MEIDKEELLRINHGFGGSLRNDSSLDFAIWKINDKKIGIYKKLAFMFRAILVDHPFSDGNKRTAAYLALKLATRFNKEVYTDILLHQIVSISKHNINDINKIERRLKNAIK